MTVSSRPISGATAQFPLMAAQCPALYRRAVVQGIAAAISPHQSTQVEPRTRQPNICWGRRWLDGCPLQRGEGPWSDTTHHLRSPRQYGYLGPRALKNQGKTMRMVRFGVYAAA